MTGRILATALVVLALVAVVVAGYVVSRSRARDVTPGAPDRLSDDIVSGLMAELRKTQAEVAYWKTAAERLQRRLDDS